MGREWEMKREETLWSECKINKKINLKNDQSFPQSTIDTQPHQLVINRNYIYRNGAYLTKPLSVWVRVL